MDPKGPGGSPVVLGLASTDRMRNGIMNVIMSLTSDDSSEKLKMPKIDLNSECRLSN